MFVFSHKFMYSVSEQALSMKRVLYKFGIIIIIPDDNTVVDEGLAKVVILVWFWCDFSALRCLSFFTCCIRACFPIFVTETPQLHTVQNAAC